MPLPKNAVKARSISVIVTSVCEDIQGVTSNGADAVIMSDMEYNFQGLL